MKRVIVLLVAAGAATGAYFYLNSPPPPKKQVTVTREDADKKMIEVLEKSKRESDRMKSIGGGTLGPASISKNIEPASP